MPNSLWPKGSSWIFCCLSEHIHTCTYKQTLETIQPEWKQPLLLDDRTLVISTIFYACKHSKFSLIHMDAFIMETLSMIFHQSTELIFFLISHALELLFLITLYIF